MRTLLLISLLGVIKCMPQQSLGISDISVQTQLRYNRQNTPKYEHNPKTIHTYTPLPLTRTAVHKNNPQSVSERLNNRRRSATHWPSFSNLKNTLPNSLYLPKIIPVRIGKTLNLPILKIDHVDKAKLTRVPVKPALFRSFPRAFERNTSLSHLKFSDLILPGSFPVFTNNNPRKRSNAPSPAAFQNTVANKTPGRQFPAVRHNSSTPLSPNGSPGTFQNDALTNKTLNFRFLASRNDNTKKSFDLGPNRRVELIQTATLANKTFRLQIPVGRNEKPTRETSTLGPNGRPGFYGSPESFQIGPLVNKTYGLQNPDVRNDNPRNRTNTSISLGPNGRPGFYGSPKSFQIGSLVNKTFGLQYPTVRNDDPRKGTNTYIDKGQNGRSEFFQFDTMSNKTFGLQFPVARNDKLMKRTDIHLDSTQKPQSFQIEPITKETLNIAHNTNKEPSANGTNRYLPTKLFRDEATTDLKADFSSWYNNGGSNWNPTFRNINGTGQNRSIWYHPWFDIGSKFKSNTPQVLKIPKNDPKEEYLLDNEKNHPTLSKILPTNLQQRWDTTKTEKEQNDPIEVRKKVNVKAFDDKTEDSKSHKHLIRKIPAKISPNKDVLNLNLNITKLDQNSYKITTKNHTLNRFNPKNTTKTNPYRPKPLVRPFFSQETKKPFAEGNNNWFQLKLKPPHPGTEKNYDYSTVPNFYLSNSLTTQNPGSVNGVEVFNSLSTENPVYNYRPDGLIISNSISSQRPNEYSTYGTDGIVVSNSLSTTPRPNGFNNPNGVNIGNTVTLSPEVVSISQGSHTLAGPELPCTNFHIANNLYNKEACQDIEITINNHVHSDNNYYEEEIEEPYEETANEYSEEDYESDEVTENAIISDDEYADELAEDALAVEPSLAESVVEPSVGEPLTSVAQSPASAASGQNGGLPGLPNRPTIPRPGSSDDDEEEGGFFGTGIFSWISSLNFFSFPLISVLAAPLTILFTSALGVSTFFLPWTILPTLFLGRKARQSGDFEKGSRPDVLNPDGWFWHNKYKTWVNMSSKENARVYDDVGNFIIKLIEEFGRRYTRNYNESWKRRKKNG